MNLNSYQYFIEIAKDLHITKTAERLFISQQNLSNHLARLEEYYGTALLERKPKLKLTYAGQIVLDFAKSLVGKELELKTIIQDIKNEAEGTLRIGGAPIRIAKSLPAILPTFSEKYPNVSVAIYDKNSKFLEELILKFELDLAIVMDPKESPVIDSTTLIHDPIYLCVDDNLLKKYYPDTFHEIKKRSINGAKVKDFINIPFSLFNNRLGREIENCFLEENLRPKIYSTSTYIQISTIIAAQGSAATFASHIGLVSTFDKLPPNLNVFPLLYKDEPLSKRFCLIHHKDQYLPSYGHYFKTLLLNYFHKIKTMNLTQIVESN